MRVPRETLRLDGTGRLRNNCCRAAGKTLPGNMDTGWSAQANAS